MNEEEVLLGKIKTQFEESLSKKGFLTKEDLDKAVAARMKAFEGLDLDQLKQFTDPDKGITAILKKQGEAITALAEGVKGKSDENPFKVALDAKLKDAEKIFHDRSSNQEIRLNVKAAAVMTTTNGVTGHSTLPDALIESFSEAAFVPKRQAREYVYDLANVTTVDEVEQYKIWLEEGSEEGAFAVVAEGGLKPLVSTSLVRNYSTVRKVAGKYVVTEEFAKFRRNAYNIIQRIIQQKMLRDKAGILTTSLLGDAASYVSSALDGQYPAEQVTDYHAIAAVAAQIEALGFVPDMLILNPEDKWRIGMLQGSNGQFFLNIPSIDPTGAPRLMGFQVRTSTKIPVGEFILGESGLWEIEQEPITVRMGYGVTVTGGTSNGGGNVTDVQPDFDHNRFRVIVEQFFHNYIASNNDGSFVHGEFDAIKELVTAEEEEIE